MLKKKDEKRRKMKETEYGKVIFRGTFVVTSDYQEFSQLFLLGGSNFLLETFLREIPIRVFRTINSFQLLIQY